MDIRFKDAAQLLSSEQTTAILSGIYALQQIAIEATKETSLKGYLKVISEIFCSYIRENSIIEKDEDDNIITVKNAKSNIITQAIIDNLFKNGKSIYDEHIFNLSKCVFCDIDFSEANIINANFGESHFENIDFERTFIKGTSFYDAHFNDNVSFGNMRLISIDFAETYIHDLHFFQCDLIEVSFANSNIHNLRFTHVRFVDVAFYSSTIIDKIVFEDYISFEKVDFGKARFKKQQDFTKSPLKEYSLEEIVIPNRSIIL